MGCGGSEGAPSSSPAEFPVQWKGRSGHQQPRCGDVSSAKGVSAWCPQYHGALTGVLGAGLHGGARETAGQGKDSQPVRRSSLRGTGWAWRIIELVQVVWLGVAAEGAGKVAGTTQRA